MPCYHAAAAIATALRRELGDVAIDERLALRALLQRIVDMILLSPLSTMLRQLLRHTLRQILRHLRRHTLFRQSHFHISNIQITMLH